MFDFLFCCYRDIIQVSIKAGVSFVISENENINDTESSELDVSYELCGYHFIWNSEKYQINCQKHNITFEEAAT